MTTGVFIYLKLDKFVSGWYNVIGYVGESPSTAITTFNVERPVIKYDNEYLELVWEPNKGIIDLLAVPENLQLLTTEEKYFTTIVDGGGNVLGTINNDLPIKYNISIKGLTETANKFTYYTYSITLDTDTLNAKRVDNSVIYQNGPSVTVTKDLVDYDIEHNTYNCKFTPLVNSEVVALPPVDKSGNYTVITFEFDDIVQAGPNFNNLSNSPIIIMDSSLSPKLVTTTVEFIKNENNFTHFGRILFPNRQSEGTDSEGNPIIKNSAQITESGTYTLYIPSAIFKVGSDNVDYIVVKFIVNAEVEEEAFLYSVSPTSTKELKNITVLCNKTFSSLTYNLYDPKGNEIAKGKVNSTNKSAEISLNLAITVVETSKYKLKFNFLDSYSANIVGKTLELDITIQAPDTLYLSKYTINGSTKIMKAGTFKYTVVPYPSKAIDADYLLSLESNNPNITLEGNELKVSKIDVNEDYTVTLIATLKLTLDPSKSSDQLVIAELKVNILWIDERDIVHIKGITINGDNLITKVGTYNYTVSITPSNATFTGYTWECNDDNFNEGTLTINNLPETLKVITIKAVSKEDSAIYAVKNITIAANKTELKDVFIVGPTKIKIPYNENSTNIYNYSITTNPSNATIEHKSIEVVGELPEGYTFNYDLNKGILRVRDKTDSGTYTLLAIIKLRATVNNITLDLDIISEPEGIPEVDYSIKSITISGPTSITQAGNYLYTEILNPTNTLLNAVLWSLLNCYYDGITINKLGLLSITKMPASDAVITILCTSAVKASVVGSYEVTLIALNPEDYKDNIEKIFDFNPKPGAVSSLKTITIQVNDCQLLLRQKAVEKIILDGPVNDTHLSGDMSLSANKGERLTLTLETEYKAFGSYKITFPEGFFSIDGENSKEMFITYTIKDPTSESSDDKSDTFGGLVTYGDSVSRFRIKNSDTIVVAEVRKMLPSIFLNPKVYYLNDKNTYTTVPEGSVLLRISYRNNEGILNIELSIEYNKVFDLTYNILNKIDVPRDIEVFVIINFDGLTVSKHFKLVFVDPESYREIYDNNNYSLIVQNITEDFELTIPVYGCSKITGYEVVQTILHELDGKIQEFNLCDDKTINKLRLGNLSNIFDERFGNKQPHGYGLYSENVYLTGNFILNNGKSLLEIDKEITAAVGEVERAKQVLNNTKNELLNSYKDTVKDLVGTLDLMNKIGLASTKRLDAIGLDGVISADEKVAVLLEWSNCISEFNGIQNEIYRLKDTILEDNLYVKILLINNELVSAFYDLNQIHKNFILDTNNMLVDTYDINPKNDPNLNGRTDIQGYISSTRAANYVFKNKNLPERTPGNVAIIMDYSYDEVNDGLTYVTDKYALDNLKYVYLYPTIIDADGTIRTEFNDYILDPDTEENVLKPYNRRLKLNYFYNKHEKEGFNLAYSNLIRTYTTLYEQVSLLLSKGVATETLVLQFNTAGEKAADKAIRNYMGNLQDATMHLGLDYSTFAMGSAGIAITNPDLVYKINGENLASYIKKELEVNGYSNEDLKDKATKFEILYNEELSIYDYKKALELKKDLLNLLILEKLELIKKTLDSNLINTYKEDLFILQLNYEEILLELNYIQSAVKKGLEKYNRDLLNANPELIEPDENSVGDGDEQLYLFGDKVKILTTDRVISEGKAYYKVSFVSDDSELPNSQNEGEKEAYILQEDLKRLKGNYTDRMLSLANNGSKSAITGKGDSALSTSTVISSDINYYVYEKSEDIAEVKVMKYKGVLSPGTNVTILYLQAAMFEGNKFNADLIQAHSLIAGTFDKITGELDEKLDYVKIGVYKTGEGPIIETLGGSLTLANSNSKEKGYVVVTSGDTETGSNRAPGFYMYDKNNHEFAKFTGEIDEDPLDTIMNNLDSSVNINKSFGWNLLTETYVKLNVQDNYLEIEDEDWYLEGFGIDDSPALTVNEDVNVSTLEIKLKPGGGLIWNNNLHKSAFVDSFFNFLLNRNEEVYLLLTITPYATILKENGGYNLLLLGTPFKAYLRCFYYAGSPYLGANFLNSNRFFNIHEGNNGNGSYAYIWEDINEDYLFFKEGSVKFDNIINGDKLLIYYRTRMEIYAVNNNKSLLQIWHNLDGLNLIKDSVSNKIIIGSNYNKYVCNFFGNGLVLGSNNHNYFGTFFNNPTGDGEKYLTFAFEANGYGMKYNSGGINSIFAGQYLRMPYTIYAGKFSNVKRTADSITYNATHFTYFPTTSDHSNPAEVTHMYYNHTNWEGFYRVKIYNVPDTINNIESLHITANGENNVDHPMHATIRRYGIEKTTSTYIYVDIIIADDASSNDGDFSLKVEYYPGIDGNSLQSSNPGSTISGTEAGNTKISSWKDAEYTKLLWGNTTPTLDGGSKALTYHDKLDKLSEVSNTNLTKLKNFTQDNSVSLMGVKVVDDSNIPDPYDNVLYVILK